MSRGVVLGRAGSRRLDGDSRVDHFVPARDTSEDPPLLSPFE